MSVSHWTTPEKRDIPALTFTSPELISTVDELTDTVADAVIVIPEDEKVIALPLASSMWTEPGASCSTSRWPPGVSTSTRALA